MNTALMGKLAQRVADQLVALHRKLDSGQITRDEFVAVATAFLDAAQARAVALADVALAAELTALRQQVVAPLGLGLPEESAQTAVDETLGGEPYRLDPLAAVAVLGRAVTLSAAQGAYQVGMAQSGITHWERVPDAGACDLCQKLTAQGAAPISVQPFHHKGCGCSTRPVERNQS